MISRPLALLLVLTAAGSQAADLGRGRLLYENFCGHCHMSEIHYRVGSRVRSSDDLRRTVDLWQREMGLGWSGEEIDDVAAWLDWAYYRLSAPEG